MPGVLAPQISPARRRGQRDVTPPRSVLPCLLAASGWLAVGWGVGAGVEFRGRREELTPLL
jgi:hypothetical protein